jgi:hypothetical protein
LYRFWESNQIKYRLIGRPNPKLSSLFRYQKTGPFFFAIGLCYARRPKHISSWHAITSLSEQNQKEMKHMGLRYDTFRVRDMHKYVITYTVAHQQYTNKCAHMQRKDKFGNNWGKRTTSNDRVSKEAADFLRLLAQARNRSVVPALRKAAV